MVLYQPINGYCYNSDTHFLYSFICKNLKKFKNVKGEILDIGSGSGILGLLVCKDYEKLNLNQIEIQEEFFFFSSKNSKINGIKNTISKGSYLEYDFEKEFDICVSNPPFYHTSVIKSENENIKIARYNDSMPLEDFIKKTSKILKQNGKFFFCYDVKQISKILIFLDKYGLNLESLQFVHPKKTKEATLAMFYARKNSKSLVKIDSPLIAFDEKGDFTQEVLEIYKNCSTHSIKASIE